MMNPNDIFRQINLEDDSEAASPSEKPIIRLEVELAEGFTDILEVKEDGDIRRQTVDYCRKRGLNLLAVELIVNKINEAKFLSDRERSKSTSSRHKQTLEQLKEELLKENKPRLMNPNKQLSKSPLRKHESQKQAGELSKSKQRLAQQKHNSEQIKEKSPNKSPEHEKKKQVKKTKDASKEAGERMYMQARIKQKMQEEAQKKQAQDREENEGKGLTFRPQINAVSHRIMQFRKGNPLPEKEQKSLLVEKNTKIEQQEEQCTFQPKINKVSSMIAQNGKGREEEDHFLALYKHAQIYRLQAQSRSELEANCFHPKINQKSKQKVIGTFEERLKTSLARRKERTDDSKHASKCSFQPNVGRAPFQRTRDEPVWDKLYEQKKSLLDIPPPQAEEPIISDSSRNYYANLIQKRIKQVFTLLDSDEDGLISRDSIAVESLPSEILIFLRPIFQELQDLGCDLRIEEFKRAMMTLLAEAGPLEKGHFVANWPDKKPTEVSQSTPAIRRPQTLYESGMRKIAEKEYLLEQERARQLQDELRSCSFKPLLKSTSKYYMQRLTRRVE